MIDFKSLAKKRRNTTVCVEVLSLVKEIIQKCNILGKITEQMCHKCNTLRIFQNLLFTTFWKVSRAIINQLFLPRMSRFKPKWDMILFTTNIQVQAKWDIIFLPRMPRFKPKWDMIFLPRISMFKQSEIWYFFTTNIQVQTKWDMIFYHEYPGSSQSEIWYFLPRISMFKQSEIWYFLPRISMFKQSEIWYFYHECPGSSQSEIWDWKLGTGKTLLLNPKYEIVWWSQHCISYSVLHKCL